MLACFLLHWSLTEVCRHSLMFSSTQHILCYHSQNFPQNFMDLEQRRKDSPQFPEHEHPTLSCEVKLPPNTHLACCEQIHTLHCQGLSWATSFSSQTNLNNPASSFLKLCLFLAYQFYFLFYLFTLSYIGMSLPAHLPKYFAWYCIITILTFLLFH